MLAHDGERTRSGTEQSKVTGQGDRLAIADDEKMRNREKPMTSFGVIVSSGAVKEVRYVLVWL